MFLLVVESVSANGGKERGKGGTGLASLSKKRKREGRICHLFTSVRQAEKKGGKVKKRIPVLFHLKKPIRPRTLPFFFIHRGGGRGRKDPGKRPPAQEKKKKRRTKMGTQEYFGRGNLSTSGAERTKKGGITFFFFFFFSPYLGGKGEVQLRVIPSSSFSTRCLKKKKGRGKSVPSPPLYASYCYCVGGRKKEKKGTIPLPPT